MHAAKELYRQISFISYYFHWDLDSILLLPHRDRESFCGEISRMNREAEGQEENNIFSVT